MTDPKTRALSLIDELEEAIGWNAGDTPHGLAQALRLAITQIPTTSWQPMETAPDGTWVRLLVVDESGHRSVQDCSHDAQGWWIAGEGYLPVHHQPLAWRPADSTELPEDWGTR